MPIDAISVLCAQLTRDLFAITKFLFFIRLHADISATVAPIGVNFCMMVHIGLGRVFSPFGGGALSGTPKSKILGLNISKTVSRSLTCQLELNISSTRPF